jgi:hypothetical protein
VSKSKQIGTAAETAVVKACRKAGFPTAERRALHGIDDLGDILLTAGVVIEVKGGKAAETASDAQVVAWLQETERERVNAHADFAFLVTKRAGIGADNAHKWWAHTTLDELCHLLHDCPEHDLLTPVRMTLGGLLYLLRTNGYGTEPVL